jgi:hypothetical protein
MSTAVIITPIITAIGKLLDIHRLIAFVISTVFAGETVGILIPARIADLHIQQNSAAPMTSVCQPDARADTRPVRPEQVYARHRDIGQSQ